LTTNKMMNKGVVEMLKIVNGLMSEFAEPQPRGPIEGGRE